MHCAKQKNRETDRKIQRREMRGRKEGIVQKLGVGSGGTQKGIFKRSLDQPLQLPSGWVIFTNRDIYHKVQISGSLERSGTLVRGWEKSLE